MRSLKLSLKKLNFKHITIIMLVSIIISVVWHYFDGSLCDVFDEKKLNLDSDVSVHYIDVGQGDCELILDHGTSILIDSGEVDQGNSVVKYLKSCGIKKIDLFIGTHPHTDHIGGFLTIAKNFDIGRIIIPELPKNIIPNRPKIMDGIPLKVSVAYSIAVTTLPGLAYSLRYIALPTPIGVAIIMVIRIISNVFTILPAIPTVPFNTLVTEVRNVMLTAEIPLINTYPIIPSNKSTENIEQIYIKKRRY